MEYKFEDLLKQTGLTIVEGGPFMFEDFGRTWVIVWEDELTAAIHLESHDVIFVECQDMSTREDMYLYMSPKYQEHGDKIYDELAGVKTHYVDDIERVFDIWFKNRDDEGGNTPPPGYQELLVEPTDIPPDEEDAQTQVH